MFPVELSPPGSTAFPGRWSSTLSPTSIPDCIFKRGRDQRFPLYFSLDVRIYRELFFHIPQTESSKIHKVRIGGYLTDITNRQNPLEV